MVGRELSFVLGLFLFSRTGLLFPGIHFMDSLPDVLFLPTTLLQVWRWCLYLSRLRKNGIFLDVLMSLMMLACWAVLVVSKGTSFLDLSVAASNSLFGKSCVEREQPQCIIVAPSGLLGWMRWELRQPLHYSLDYKPKPPIALHHEQSLVSV